MADDMRHTINVISGAMPEFNVSPDGGLLMPEMSFSDWTDEQVADLGSSADERLPLAIASLFVRNIIGARTAFSQYSFPYATYARRFNRESDEEIYAAVANDLQFAVGNVAVWRLFPRITREENRTMVRLRLHLLTPRAYRIFGGQL